MTQTLPPMLSVEAAATALGVSISWLNKARQTGEGPVFTKVGARCLYSADDLGAWLASRRRTSTSQIVPQMEAR